MLEWKVFVQYLSPGQAIIERFNREHPSSIEPPNGLVIDPIKSHCGENRQ